MSDREIAAMREANDRLNRTIAKRRLMLIEDSNGTWRVEDDTREGVAPQSRHADAVRAVARAIQLLGIATPVAPQNWPEDVCIGRVELAGEPARDPEWHS